MDVLVFQLEYTRYAVPVAAVAEVVRAVALAPIAGAPRAIDGVFSLRGELVPVVDVRARFGLESRPIDSTQHFVLVRRGARLVALRVDRADTLVRIDEQRIGDARHLVPSAPGVAGVAVLEDGIVVIHDVDAFLTQAEADALAPALDAATSA